MLRRVTAICLAAATIEAAADAVDAKLSGEPTVAAEAAFRAGDRRHIIIPVCGKDSGEVIPGWPLEWSPAHDQAMKDGRRPITCADLGNDPKHKNFIRAVKFAERYNQRLRELEGKGSK